MSEDPDESPDETDESAEPRDTQPDEPPRPLLRIVRGNPTPEEIAALVAVLASTSAPAESARRPVRAWSAPERGVRRTLPHGRGGWRASSLPR